MSQVFVCLSAVVWAMVLSLVGLWHIDQGGQLSGIGWASLSAGQFVFVSFFAIRVFPSTHRMIVWVFEFGLLMIFLLAVAVLLVKGTISML